MTTLSVIPQARSLGSRSLYETVIRRVFAAGQPVLVEDLRSYCLDTVYRCGSQLNGVLEVLLNLEVLHVEGDCLTLDNGLLNAEGDICLALAARLMDRLVKSQEVGSVFPVGSISWGRSPGELDIHLSHIPLRSLAVVKLLRDLDLVLDSNEGVALLKVHEPFSRVLRDAVTVAFSSRSIVKKFSPEALEHLQEAQMKQGAEAEEYVLRYEQRRLKGHAQIGWVRRISVVNVAAGYDIDSFEGLRSFLPDRFIEVKSHRGEERFFLSSGELEVARELGDRYVLYLVDMEKCELPEYSPLMIRNPAVELFNQASGWAAVATTFEIAKKRSSEGLSSRFVEDRSDSKDDGI